MVYRSSFSQHWKFTHYPRLWFFEKILKIPVLDQDMCHANAGSVVHKCLELWYKKDIWELESLKQTFFEQWKSYKLDESKIKNSYDEYWGMVLNGKDKNITPTSCEMKFFWDDLLCFMDAVDTNNNIIYDWKSSRISEDNKEEYRHQMLLYAWAYKRKFGIIPSQCIVYYLRGIDSKLVITPTEEEVKLIEDWYKYNSTLMEEYERTKRTPKKCDTCSPFCPYEEQCNAKMDELRYTIAISGAYIYLKGEITELLLKGIEKKFSFELKDSYFIKQQRPGYDAIIHFYNKHQNRLEIGFLDGLKKTLQDYATYTNRELSLNIDDFRRFNSDIYKMPDKFVNGRSLRDYQIEAVNAILNNKICMIEVGTGGGKTEILIEVIRRLGYKTLFIVDRRELLKQTIKRIEDSLGIEVGCIGNGKMDIKHVTVATIQSMKKVTKEYLDSIRVVIFDECHKAAARNYYKLGRHLMQTEYRIGVSGTAFRDDGLDMYLTATLGKKVFSLSSKELIEKGWLQEPKIIFIKDYIDEKEKIILESKCLTYLINEEPDYARYYTEIIKNNNVRNSVIQKIVNDNGGKSVLILTKLVEHGEELAKLCNGKHLYGATNKTDRDKMLEEFKEGKFKVLVSTVSIFSEGIDLPFLEIIINASANAGQVKTIQMLGRVLRKNSNKNSCKYYDFVDDYKFFSHASYKRRKTFINQGHEVEVLKYDSLVNV